MITPHRVGPRFTRDAGAAPLSTLHGGDVNTSLPAA